jgi:hypothetical protein
MINELYDEIQHINMKRYWKLFLINININIGIKFFRLIISCFSRYLVVYVH